MSDLANVIIDNLRFYLRRGDISLLAWVLMPEHFHLLLKMADGHSLSSVIGNLKRITSRQIVAILELQQHFELLEQLATEAAKQPTQDSRVWQYRFDSLVITSESTLKEKFEYIHNNPVQRGLVLSPVQWTNSSAADYDGRLDGPLPVDIYWECLGYGKLLSGKDS